MYYSATFHLEIVIFCDIAVNPGPEAENNPNSAEASPNSANSYQRNKLLSLSYAPSKRATTLLPSCKFTLQNLGLFVNPSTVYRPTHSGKKLVAVELFLNPLFMKLHSHLL